MDLEEQLLPVLGQEWKEINTRKSRKPNYIFKGIIYIKNMKRET